DALTSPPPSRRAVGGPCAPVRSAHSRQGPGDQPSRNRGADGRAERAGGPCHFGPGVRPRDGSKPGPRRGRRSPGRSRSGPALPWGVNPIEYLQLLVYGIVLGSIIALAAIGLSLTYGILNFANFAHGDFVTLGAYLTLLLRVGFGLPLAPSLLLAMAGTALLAVAVDKLLYRRLRARGPVTLLIASVGVA